MDLLLDFANPKSRMFSCIWVMRARMTRVTHEGIRWNTAFFLVLIQMNKLDSYRNTSRNIKTARRHWRHWQPCLTLQVSFGNTSELCATPALNEDGSAMLPGTPIFNEVRTWKWNPNLRLKSCIVYAFLNMWPQICILLFPELLQLLTLDVEYYQLSIPSHCNMLLT